MEKNYRKNAFINNIRRVQSMHYGQIARCADDQENAGAYIMFPLSNGYKDFLIVDLAETREGKRVSGATHPGVLFQIVLEGSSLKKQYTPEQFYFRTAESLWRDYNEETFQLEECKND